MTLPNVKGAQPAKPAQSGAPDPAPAPAPNIRRDTQVFRPDELITSTPPGATRQQQLLRDALRGTRFGAPGLPPDLARNLAARAPSEQERRAIRELAVPNPRSRFKLPDPKVADGLVVFLKAGQPALDEYLEKIPEGDRAAIRTQIASMVSDIEAHKATIAPSAPASSQPAKSSPGAPAPGPRKPPEL